MTKQHFVAFAEAIKSAVQRGEVESAKSQAALVANIAVQFNPRFDLARFYKACGLND